MKLDSRLLIYFSRNCLRRADDDWLQKWMEMSEEEQCKVACEWLRGRLTQLEVSYEKTAKDLSELKELISLVQEC